MSIIFQCRHCATTIGAVSTSEVTETMLGIHMLSKQDQEEMIEYKADGTMVIVSICEACEETLRTYPELHELHYFIH